MQISTLQSCFRSKQAGLQQLNSLVSTYNHTCANQQSHLLLILCRNLKSNMHKSLSLHDWRGAKNWLHSRPPIPKRKNMIKENSPIQQAQSIHQEKLQTKQRYKAWNTASWLWRRCLSVNLTRLVSQDRKGRRTLHTHQVMGNRWIQSWWGRLIRHKGRARWLTHEGRGFQNKAGSHETNNN